MIENNTIFCLEFSVFLYPLQRLNFSKEFNGGKINFFGGFVHISRTYIGYIVWPYQSHKILQVFDLR